MGALLQLRDAVKCFRMGERDVEVLHGIDLDVCEGEFVALVDTSRRGLRSAAAALTEQLLSPDTAR